MKKIGLLTVLFILVVGVVVVQAKTTIEVWYHEYGEAGTSEAVKEYARMFEEEHPDIDVKVVWVPGDYDTKLNTALLSGE